MYCFVGVNVGVNKISVDFIVDYEMGIKVVFLVCFYIIINILSFNMFGLCGL